MNHQEEDTFGKAYDARLVRRLLGYLKPYKKLAGWSLLLLMVGRTMQLLSPMFVQIAVDRHAVPQQAEGLLRLCVLWLTVIIFGVLLEFALQYIMGLLGGRVILDIRLQLFRKLQSLRLAYFDRNPVGRLLTRVMGDVDVLGEMFGPGVVSILGDIFFLLGAVIFMLAYNFKLTVVSLLIIPLLVVVTFYFRTRMRANWRRVRVRIARVNANLNENIQGMRTVQLFGREKRNFSRFEKLNLDHLQAVLKSVFYHAVFQPSMDIIRVLQLVIIFFYGGSMVLRGELEIGVLLAFFGYAELFFRPIRALAEKYNQMQAAMASAERIFQIVDSQEMMPQVGRPQALPRWISKIEFAKVSLAYKDDDRVLQDVSFKIKRGEKVALVGETGAGKTSIASLLCRFYEASGGEILFDGRDIKKLSLNDLRRRIGIVQQDVFLFSGNVLDNINLRDRGIKQSAIQRAAKAVNLTSVISALPGKFKAEVLEGGSNFSAGQKQLIAFARALAFDPEILILDEATANIDTKTELLIQDAIGKLLKGRTSIIVAHRLSTIQKCDKIIVMHKGRVKEMGTHQQLLKKRGLYYKLYLLQYKDQEVA